MTWLAWRQFRVPAVSVLAGLVAVGVLLAITGPGLVGRTDFSNLDELYSGTLIAVYALPAVVGVFWGVPVVTREIENGTHRLVWSQSVTRERWLATKLGMGVAAAAVATGLLSLAVGWWAAPVDAAASSDDGVFGPRISPLLFAARGVAPIGYAAFAFVLGVAVGIVLRRTVAAMAVTLVVFAAVQLAVVPHLVRPHLLPATEETVAITRSDIWQIRGNDSGVVEALTVWPPADTWVLVNETVNAAGEAVSPLPDAVQDCLPDPDAQEAPPDRRSITACFERLTDLGYRQHLVYHPGSRFWPLQWIELALYLALSALLAWFCFRRLRHLS